MTRFVLRGQARHVSREQMRSFIQASLSVLAYHGLMPAPDLVVSVRRRITVRCMDGTKAAGYYQPPCLIVLGRWLAPEDMLSAVLHEVVHACVQFPRHTLEKCTSTLTARLKADVARVAEVLLDGTYRRAAAIAHTKGAYRAAGPDHYDPDQDNPVGVTTKYHRRRK